MIAPLRAAVRLLRFLRTQVTAHSLRQGEIPALKRAAHQSGLRGLSPRRNRAGWVTGLSGRIGSLRITVVPARDFFPTRNQVVQGYTVSVRGLGYRPGEIRLRLESAVGATERRWQAKEMVLGDPVFDEWFYIQGAPGLVRAVCDTETRILLSRLASGSVTPPGRVTGSTVDASVRLIDDELTVQFRSPQPTRGRDDERPLHPERPASMVEILSAVGLLAQRLVRPSDTVARLVECMEQEPSFAVRQGIVTVLSREFRRHPLTTEALRRALDDPDPEVRLRAAIALGEEGHTVLRAVLEAEQVRDDLLTMAFEAHGAALPLPRVLELLDSSLRTGRTGTAFACLELLGEDGSPDALRTLSRLAQAQGGAIGAAAVEALGRIGPSAEPALLKALQSRDTPVRRAAARALGSTGSSLAVAPLRSAADSERGDRELARAVREAIAAIHSRIAGAAPGQLSLAGGEVGQVSLVEPTPGVGALSMTPEGLDRAERT